jgi:hypothetical protein
VLLLFLLGVLVIVFVGVGHDPNLLIEYGLGQSRTQ